jgi:predicted nuclease with TOPRIM domain
MPEQDPRENPEYGSLHWIRDLASRNDERIKLLMEKNEEIVRENNQMEKELEEFQNQLQTVTQEMASLTARMNKVDGIWDRIFDNFWKIILMIIGGSILYFLGLQSPPLG